MAEEKLGIKGSKYQDRFAPLTHAGKINSVEAVSDKVMDLMYDEVCNLASEKHNQSQLASPSLENVADISDSLSSELPFDGHATMAETLNAAWDVWMQIESHDEWDNCEKTRRQGALKEMTYKTLEISELSSFQC